METQVHREVLDLLANHLDQIGQIEKLSFLLYTRGGETLAAWSIVNLLRQYCRQFVVIIPSVAHSAGTLICLGANEIIMTRQSTLGPIDPSVNTPLNPTLPGGTPNQRVPVSVEAINGFFELAKQHGIEKGEDVVQVMSALSSQVHPLVLGQASRSRSQIKMLGTRLLRMHMDNEEQIENIVSFLASESGSHDYTIFLREARDELHLNVSEPDDDLYQTIRNVYRSIASELELSEPYNPDLLRAGLRWSTKFPVL